ncbi:MAG TPA: D-alanyl-D-alanine carboxypeptidase family protein [Bacillota bacterium]|nr:D-alanyl-D-alanine carboxypeptidase family protein [Bacillota bacterium]
MKNRLIASLLILLMNLNITTAFAGTKFNNLPPEIVGTAGALIDGQSGQLLYTKNENQRMFPASTTKILTTLIALEKGKLDDTVTITEEPTRADGSAVYLQQGETITLEELLYCIMLNSANDASVAVAQHIGGSIKGFAKLMNEKARSLGATDSNFTNPNGLPDPDHYTTAHDLALIAKAAMQNPKFREIAGTKTKDINRTPADALTRLINHNKLLWRYQGATGVKTGYTVVAQQCLVGSAKQGDREVIAVVLGSVGKNIWQDVPKLLDYGFDNYHTMTLIEAGKQIRQVQVSNSDIPVLAVSKNPFYYTTDRKNTTKPQMQVNITKGLQAPISQGSKIGQLIFNLEGTELGRVDLVAGNSLVARRSSLSWLKWVGGLGLAGVGLLIASKVSRARRRRLRSRRYKVYTGNY